MQRQRGGTSARDLAAPRVVAADLGAGLYESHYLTAVDPAGGRALWLRHTGLKRPGAVARPTVWIVWFDRERPRPIAVRVTGSDPVGDPGSAWARSDLGEIAPGRAAGAIEDASWDLRWEPWAAELPYLPARWLYDRTFPRSNGAALAPRVTVSGQAALPGGGRVVLDGWDGMIGHNWGTEHAERWTWLHTGGIGPDRSGWVDLLLVRVRVGRLLTPWLAAGALELSGRRHPVSRSARPVCSRVGEHARVAVGLARGLRIELDAHAPPEATATWEYASPEGRGRIVRNCSVADGSIRLLRRGGSSRLELPGRLAVEHGAPGA